MAGGVTTWQLFVIFVARAVGGQDMPSIYIVWTLLINMMIP